MGLFENDFDTDILRAIGYAKLHQAAGSGLESIIRSLAAADLGVVTGEMAPLLERMHEGEPTDGVLKRAIRKSKNPGWGKFLGALMAEGERGSIRLDELSEEILAEKANKAREYSGTVSGFMQGAAVVFLGTFATVFLKVLEQIPENAILPTFDFGPAFYAGIYAALGAALAFCFFGMWYRG